MKNVLLADDHPMVRRGLKQMLEDEFPGVQIGEASDAASTLEAANGRAWDLILLDINLPGRSGLEVLDDLKASSPDVPVLVFSIFPEKDYAMRAFKLGASGFLCKKSDSDELLVAVKKVLAGGRYVTPALAETLAAALAGETPAVPHETLSNRELEVLRKIANGQTVKEIASELNLSEKTIGTYRARISEKLRLSTNVELTRYALQHKLVD